MKYQSVIFVCLFSSMVTACSGSHDEQALASVLQQFFGKWELKIVEVEAEDPAIDQLQGVTSLFLVADALDGKGISITSDDGATATSIFQIQPDGKTANLVSTDPFMEMGRNSFIAARTDDITIQFDYQVSVSEMNLKFIDKDHFEGTLTSRDGELEFNSFILTLAAQRIE